MNAIAFPIAKLRLGRIFITPHAKDMLPDADVQAAIGRHQAGDWGDLEPEDRSANDRALIKGTRIISAYQSQNMRFWILTEADRSRTTVLFPEEY